jgi:hypothetical protein
MTKFNFPGPCQPKYKKPEKQEDYLKQARIYARKTHGRAAMGPVQKGDNILIVTFPDQDENISEAITEALREEGANRVDFICEHELSETEPRVFSIEDGWKEADTVENTPWDMSGSLFYSDLKEGLQNYLTQHPEYTGVFYGLGGRGHLMFQLGDHMKKFRGCWLLNNWEEFMSKVWTYPEELEIEIERTIIDAIGSASEVRITDPEGTHLEYSLTAEEAKRWQMGAWLSGHLFLDPLQATADECAMSTTPFSLDVPPVFPYTSGVLAGTANHMGFITRIELYFEDGLLVEVKGGGKYGEKIRYLMDKYKEVHWPGYRKKGFFWFCDSVVCTLVKSFRRTSDMFQCYWRLPNIGERNRAGVFHLGIGSRRHGSAYLEYAKANNLPTGHIHVHNYFATFEIRLQGSKYWHKIIDKGWVTGMNEPAIRALATKYGDPDELLSFDWIPPLPGINCDGNYLQDYASDPMAYLNKRLKAGEPI